MSDFFNSFSQFSKINLDLKIAKNQNDEYYV